MTGAVIPDRRSTLLGAGLLGIIAAAALTATAVLVAPPGFAARTIFSEAFFVLPGLLLVQRAAGRTAGWLPVVAFGPILGFGLSSLSLLALWLAGARGDWSLIVAPLLWMPLVPLAGRVAGRWHLPSTVAADRPALTVLVLVVPLLVAAPFANVGRLLPEGKAYRAYFTADYVWRQAVVAEVAKGDVLPRNPFYIDDALHYYWLPHLPSAVRYRNGTADLDQVLLLHSVVADVWFVAFLFGLARWLVPVPWACAAGVAAAIVASSFEGLYALVTYASWGVPLSLVRYLNIDAVSRWFLEAMPIDGLQRVLFYQPHHAIGYGLGFMGVLAVAARRRRFDPTAFAVAGVLLGLSTLVSSFAGLMLTTVAAAWEAASVVRWRDWWRATVHATAAALPLVLAAALVTVLEYVDRGGSIIALGPNPIAFHNVLLGTAISFGPLLPCALLAAWLLARRRDSRGLVFAALWATCVAYYFFVDIRDHQDVYVGWRVGHLWFIASAALASLLFASIANLPAPRRRPAIAAVVSVLSLAVPTVAIDVYNTQDILNWEMAAGFRWTLILSPDELDLLAWIKLHTAPDAVVQIDPIARQEHGWAYVPAFAQRRLGVGLPISMVPLRKYQEGSRSAAWLFETSSVESAHSLARRMGVDYVLLGAPERAAHPTAQARFDAGGAYFEVVYRNDAATVYRVR